MMQTMVQSVITVAVIAAVTFFTRALPFILFPPKKEIPEYIRYLGNVLPYSVIGMLIIYCLKDVSVSSYSFGLPELISILCIVLIHKWRHNTLLSIGGGTVLYMMLVQYVF